MENKVLALVEGREIKESDLKLLVKNLGQNAAYFQGEEGRKKLIEELVMHELMYLDAVERNLESEEEFLEVFKEMKRSMLQQYNLRKMFNSITLSDEELKDFYEENKKLYNLPEMVEASHILVNAATTNNKVNHAKIEKSIIPFLPILACITSPMDFPLCRTEAKSEP
jgi:peptidyl-prolyl cis-trans isomerase C